ncbi:CAP domain-containing protein [Gymnopilus junonius]|uniref:CAP domain-containing protein n=1 Tax=Gymnopilus junonius TaxID=109634 RepID=A0A9P5NY97_GYMJU|nr:CAP domain-containing protein [Gymnopilus junonius]
MARANLLISFLALACLPSSLAGPACARKYHGVTNCFAVCKSRWGWTGSMMGTDPWGSVVRKVDTPESWDAVISQACGSPVVATSTASSIFTSSFTESTASPTGNVISAAVAASATTSASVAIITTTSVPHAPSSSTSSVVKKTTLGLLASSRHTTSAVAQVQTSSVNKPAQSPVATTKTAQNTPPPAPKTSAPHNTPAPSPSPSPASAPAPASGNDGTTSNADIQAYLAGHNTIRAQHGASPLTWNDNLASKAQQWANNCKFVHSGGSLGPFGENLAAGTGSDYGIATAIKSWTDEVSQYNPNNPVPSHFTQVVWKATTEVGCAVQSCSGIFAASFGLAKFFVCEYSVQGNVIGEFAQNVQV